MPSGNRLKYRGRIINLEKRLGGGKKLFQTAPLLVMRSMPESQSIMVTVPQDWNLEYYAKEKRKFPSVQDYIRELIRRDIEEYEKTNK